MLSSTCDIVPVITVGECKAAKRHIVHIYNPCGIIIIIIIIMIHIKLLRYGMVCSEIT